MSTKSASKIHETAVIAPGARIGKDVEIGAFTVIYIRWHLRLFCCSKHLFCKHSGT